MKENEELNEINYIDKYSKKDLIDMDNLIGVVLFDILKDSIPYDRRVNMYASMITMKHLREGYVEEIAQAYHDEYPEIASEVEAGELNRFNLENKYVHIVPKTTYSMEDGLLSAETYFNHKMLNGPIKRMIDGLKELNGLLDDYLKKEQLTEAERSYVMIIRQAMDVYISGEHQRLKSDSPMFLNAIHESYNTIETNKAGVELSIGQNDEVKVKYIGTQDANWKESIKSIEGSPILDTLTKEVNVYNKWKDFVDKKGVDRSEMIAVYEDYNKTAKKLFSMTEEEFAVYYDKGHLQNPYDQVVRGGRDHHYIRYEAEAKMQLLKAGYPSADINALSKFYVALRDEKYSYEKSGKNDPEDMKRHEDNLEVWKLLVKDPPVNAQTRKHRINFLTTMMNLSGAKHEKVRAEIQARQYAKLDPIEELSLSDNIKGLYDALNTKTIDPGYVKSSDEYKKMKEDILKLSQIDKEKEPEKYEVQKEKAYNSTKKYVEHKNEEMKDPKHKRSTREAQRVKTANAVLDSLDRLKRADAFAERAINDKNVIGENTAYENAKEFVKNADNMKAGLELIHTKLDAFKKKLDLTADGSSNSKVYKKLYDSITKCMEVMKDPEAKPAEILKALQNVNKGAYGYKNDKDTALLGHTGKRTGARYKISKDIIEEVPVLVNYYENLRIPFSNVKDDKNYTYSTKSYEEIAASADKLREKYRDNLEAEPKPGHDEIKPYMAIYEVSETQRMIRKQINKLSPFMGENYMVDRKPSRYSALAKNMSLEDYAKSFVAMSYLDKTYKEGFDVEKLEQLHELINDKEAGFEFEVKLLTKSKAFKDLVKNNPDKLFEKYKSIDDKNVEIVMSCEDFLNRTARENRGEAEGYEGGLQNYMSAAMRTSKNRAAEVIVCTILSNPIGMSMTESIAADPLLNPKNAIRMLQKKVCEYMKKDPRKGYNYFYRDAEEMTKIAKFMDKTLKNYQKELKTDNNLDKIHINNNNLIDSIDLGSLDDVNTIIDNKSRTDSMDSGRSSNSSRNSSVDDGLNIIRTNSMDSDRNSLASSKSIINTNTNQKNNGKKKDTGRKSTMSK